MLEEEAAPRPCGHPAAANNLQVERVLKSWSQARRLIKDMLVHVTKEARKKHAVAECFSPSSSSSNSAHNPVVPLRDTSTKVHSGVDADNFIVNFCNDLGNVTKLKEFLEAQFGGLEAPKDLPNDSS